MTAEPFSYRARKWMLQKTTHLFHRPTQFTRLEDEAWDVLVVLDACGAGHLQEVAPWPVDACVSPATQTPDWLEAAERAGVLADATVVAANPQYSKVDPNLGTTEVIDLSESAFDDSLGTVPPDPVLDRAVEVTDGGDGPVVVHLLQPHGPYIHRVGGSWVDGLDTDWRDRPSDHTSLQVAMAAGSIDPAAAKRAHRASTRSICETLEPYLEHWLADGATIAVTADHGEVFGELRNARLFAHPGKCYLPALTRVPFSTFVPPRDVDRTSRDRLEALGYV